MIQCNNVLNRLEKISADQLKRLNEYKGQVHSYIGNCYLEMKEFDKALENHQMDHKFAKKW